MENKEQTAFLDILVTQGCTKKFELDVFEKDINTHTYFSYKSYHISQQKIVALTSLFRRLLSFSLNLAKNCIFKYHWGPVGIYGEQRKDCDLKLVGLIGTSL